jgi:hypothetical protein
MSRDAHTAAPVPAPMFPGSLVGWSAETQQLTLFAVATLAAFAHTVDEMRIGQFIAVPFAAANLALLAGWPRLHSVRRAWSSIAFGLFWGLTVIPYHVLPLIEGEVTGQNVSGLLRLAGGAAMVGLGVFMLRHDDATGPDVPM